MCVCVCVCARAQVCMHACVRGCVCVSVRRCACMPVLGIVCVCVCTCRCACMRVHMLSCVRLCDPMDCSPPGSSIHGILQVRTLEGGCHFLLQGILPTQRSNRRLLCLLQLAGEFFTTEPPGRPLIDLAMMR